MPAFAAQFRLFQVPDYITEISKGPFRTKKSTALESVLFCHRGSFFTIRTVSCLFFLEKQTLLSPFRIRPYRNYSPYRNSLSVLFLVQEGPCVVFELRFCGVVQSPKTPESQKYEKYEENTKSLTPGWPLTNTKKIHRKKKNENGKFWAIFVCFQYFFQIFRGQPWVGVFVSFVFFRISRIQGFLGFVPPPAGSQFSNCFRSGLHKQYIT